MKKRETLIVLAALAAAPLAARAQAPGKVWRIGWLGPSSGPSENVQEFRDAIQAMGYIEGRNLNYEFRWSAGRDERLAELAAELVRLKVDIIVAQSTTPVAAAKRATSSIPIVMSASGDPVGTGLVASLARPGGNVTGMSFHQTELSSKRLQLLREILPKVTRVAVLALKSPGGSTPLIVQELQSAARKMGITLVIREENEAKALASAFATMQKERAQALIVQSSPFATEHRKTIVELALRQRLPTIIEARQFVVDGGLISYGPSLPELFRRAAYYVDRIFKGAKPADLPVEQPTRFEMVVNLKTAKALGITVPQTVLLQADEVIK